MNSEVIVNIKLIKGGRIPSYGRNGDVCLDCFARCNEPIEIENRERKLIPLGFILELPEGYEAIVRPRSGKSLVGIDCTIGTIDTNYRGEVMACIINNSTNVNENIIIENGAKICQLAVRRSPIVRLNIVNELSDTERGSSGFGSSGD